MNTLERLLHSSFGKIIISILLGLGLASLFRKTCKDRDCMVFRPPPMKEVNNQVYQYGDKCYKFKEHAVPCNSLKKRVEFA